MFAKVRNNKTVHLIALVAFSLLIWLLLGAAVIISLARWRALDSLKQVTNQKAPFSQAQIQSISGNIQKWVSIYRHLGMDLKNSTTLPDLTKLIGNCLENRQNLGLNLSLFCPECELEIRNELTKLSLMLELDLKYQAESELLEKQNRALNLSKDKNWNFHFLIAKDFAALTGSQPLYDSNGKNELLYYKSGPFKWLPLLDNSNPVETQEALEVEDFSRQINLLREHSRKLVEEYEENCKDLQKNTQNFRNLENLQLANRSQVLAHTVKILQTVVF